MKKINLIEWLSRNSHEKQSPQRFARYAAMLIMLLTLGAGQMWGYTIIRNGELNGGGDWSNSDAMTRIGSTNVYYKTYNSPTATTDLFFRIGTGDGWGTKKDNSGIDNLNSNIVMLATSEHDNCVRFQVPVSVPVTIYYNDNTDKIWIKVDSYKTDVLNGKEMFYYGFTNSWSETFAHFYDNGTRKFGNYAANSYADHSAKLAIGVYDVNGSTNYSASNSDSWAGETHTGMAAGCQIQTYNDGSNKCYYNAASTFSFGTTAFTIVTGQTIASFPTISFTSKTSGVGSSLSLEGYYYSTATNGETWTAFTPGTTESSLAAGTYYIKAIATDGAIYMASTNYITLTVNSAPVLGVANATSVTSNSATFNATATLNSNTTSSYGFKYGAGASYDTKAELISGGTSASTTGALDGTTFSKEVTGLSASTTYYYISYAVVNGTTYYSDAVKSFTTSAAATYNLSVVAGTGISAVTGSTNNISANQSIAITATVATGYTWSTWTKTGAGTLSTFTAGTKDQTVKVGAVGNMTLTASATENMSTLTTSNSYNAGDPRYAIPTKSASSIGISTTATLTATTPSTGYTFAGWTLSDNLVVTSGDKDNDLSIIVRTNGNGAEATAQANYNEVLTSTYYLVGNNLDIFPGDETTWKAETNNMLRKASGSSTGSVGSITINVKSTPANNNDYQFKIHESTENKWWGWSNENYYWMDATKTTSLYDNQHNLYFIPNALGDYTFSVDWSNASEPSLTVTFPATTYTVNFGQGAGTAGSASATYSSTSFSSGTKVQDGKSITLTAPSASSGYTWDGWYNASSGGSKVSSENPLITTVSSSNHDFYARYTEITHTVTLSNGGHGHVEIGGATVTSVSGVGYATASGTITAVPDPGYYFTGWTGAINSGVTLASGTASSASITINATADSKTITANFAPIWRITGGNDDDSDAMGDWSTTANQITHITTSAGVMTSGYVEMTLPANTDYQFKVYDASVDKYYGKSGDVTKMEYSNRATAVTLSYNTGSNQTFRTAAAGTYRFTWTGSQVTITYPTSFKVTFGKGTGGLTITASGSTTGSISSGDYVVSGEDVTFTETHTTPGYTFTGWYTTKDTGGSSVSGMSTSDSQLDDIAADATVWSRYSENMTTVNLVASPTGKGAFTSGGGTVTSVSAGVTTHPAVTAVPATGYRVNTSATVWSESSDYISLSSTSTNPTTITATGTTGNSATLTATFTPKTYTITLNQNGATTESSPTSLTATFDAKANGASDVFTLTNPERTGYTFRGWNTAADTSGVIIVTWAKYYEWNTAYVDATGHWINDGDVEVFAMWKSNTYAVTLSTSGETGYGSSAPSNQTATYGTALPTITPPVGAPGYKFMGYFTEANGAGTQYYNADGTSAHEWDIASASTLHAHFQKTVISTLEHLASIAKGDVVTLDVNPVLNQTDATNYMDICWSLLYDNDNPVESGVAVASNPAVGKPNQVRFTLTGLSAGYYKVKAVLKANASSFVACDAGTELSTFKSNVRIAGNSNVTILYQDASGNTIHENGSVEVARGETVEVTAPEIIGYSFNEWVLGDVLATEDALTDNPITISAEYDGHLTAKYNKKQMIYFNNTLGWEDVYVYFYNDASGNQYWADGYGTGANQYAEFGSNKPYWEMEHGHMTQIEGTDIWYFDFKAAGYNTTRTKVAFADIDQSLSDAVRTNAKDYFQNAHVVYRTDFDATNLPMFVPINSVLHDYTNTGSKYYRGYWMNYPESTGYTLKIYDNTGNDASLVKERNFEFSANKALPMSVTVDLEGGNKTYGFKIYRADDTWFSNGGTMTNGHSGDAGQTVWGFGTDVSNNCGLTTTSAGNYTFTLDYNSGGYHQVGVHYPESTGDFRVMYIDDVRITNHGGVGNEGKSWLLSSVIPGNTASDTISYFVRAENSKHPKYKIQKCTISDEQEEDQRTVSWADQGTAINVPDSITRDSVYNFIFTKDNSGNLVLEKIEPYEGNFYIRVDGAGSSNWDNFRAADHLMPYSDYSFKQSENPYSHYFTQWYKVEKVGGEVKVKNIKFVVANDYSVCVSDTIVKDGVADDYVDANGYLTRSANIRFMYNHKTNVATRRYVDGAQESDSEFLMIIPGNSKIYAAAEGGVPLTQLTFSDKGNWIYEAEVYALPTATYKLRSKFGEDPKSDDGDWERKGVITQYFKGDESTTETLIGGDSESTTRVKIRLLYDFKTNRVVAAYQPSSGTISEDMAINADIMFMREHQEDIEQITFAEGKSISEIENIYCGLRFNKWTLNNKSKEAGHATLSPLLSRYERDIFYVSFPYDVRLSDVIGFGTYGQHWIVEYYDGAARAKNGFWADSESYWKFVTPSMKDTFELKAGTGYIVALDLDELYYISPSAHASIWDNTDEVELLFPGKVSSISNVDVTYNMPSHECKINRGTTAGNRTKKDSHWNVLGVPTFKNITGAASADGGGSGEIRFANVALLDTLVNDLKFIYDGNLADNSLTPKAVKDFEFKAMHAYVVQYCGNVTFTTSATPAPASVAARTYAEAPQEVDFRLELNKDGVVEDQTFVSMTNNEDASADFRFGEDMSKEFNSNRANIYTFIGTEWVAGNTLPMTNQTTIVPVGVKIAADGEYTFSIPEGTYGVGITLIDNEAGARVNLGLMDYTVTLAAGQIDDRFVLEISPISQISTDVEAVTGDGLQVTGARKIMIDGLLYIVKDGVVYDAQGRRL